MLWFHISTALLLLAALVLPGAGLSRRRSIEVVTLLVIPLPLLRLCLESVLPAPFHASWPAFAPSLEDSALANNLPLLLGCLWLLGAAFHGFILLRRWRGVQHLKVHAETPNQECIHKIATCLDQPEASIRQSFRVSAEVKSPLVLPGLRSLILLPANWDSWPLRLQAGAVRHEWHHLKNHDALWNVWMSLFRSVFWFHPLAWISVKAWTDACEDEADLAAVGSSDPADYAQDLLGIAILQPQMAHPAALGFLGSSRVGLQRRIRALLTSPYGTRAKKSWALSLAAPTAIGIIALSCAWLGARRQQHELQQQIQHDEAALRLSANAFPADA